MKRAVLLGGGAALLGAVALTAVLLAPSAPAELALETWERLEQRRVGAPPSTPPEPDVPTPDQGPSEAADPADATERAAAAAPADPTEEASTSPGLEAVDPPAAWRRTPSVLAPELAERQRQGRDAARSVVELQVGRVTTEVAIEQPAGYRFDLGQGVSGADAFRAMRSAHNKVWDGKKTWAYGDAYRAGVCSTGSAKSDGCDGGSWTRCGSNTYPAGWSPGCVSGLGVWDQHGNAAEHMNLPVRPEQMASTGSQELGHTEMKGSWFVWDQVRAHEDACRWRAPYWHGDRVMADTSHRNYHLGFRCCATRDPGP